MTKNQLQELNEKADSHEDISLKIQRQKPSAEQHLLEEKCYFMAGFLNFCFLSQGDVYELYPHRRYKFHNISKKVILDVHTKIRSIDKTQRKKLQTNLFADFNVCKETFWENFAEISNKITKDKTITHKRMSNARSVLNSIMTYAIGEEFI